jgi:hypothetical protein
MYIDRDRVTYLDIDRDEDGRYPRPSSWQTFTCRKCGEPATADWQDTGIGAYEYWGARGVDTRMELLSNCCGAEVYED